MWLILPQTPRWWWANGSVGGQASLLDFAPPASILSSLPTSKLPSYSSAPKQHRPEKQNEKIPAFDGLNLVLHSATLPNIPLRCLPTSLSSSSAPLTIFFVFMEYSDSGEEESGAAAGAGRQTGGRQGKGLGMGGDVLFGKGLTWHRVGGQRRAQES